MAIKERDILLQGQEDGEQTMDFPITRLANVEGDAEVKSVPGDKDYIPIIDSADGEQMKKAPISAFQRVLTGTAGQIVGFDKDGNPEAQAKPKYTASDVGAIPIGGQELTDSNLDLNNYTTPGWYMCKANALAATYTNCPTEKSFLLEVLSHVGTMQRVTSYLIDDPRIWVRNYSTGAKKWGEWVQLYTSANKSGVTDITLAPEMHRMWFRGKNLGTSFTAAQKAAIQAGTFDDLFLGDYWVIGGVTWRIVDMDYWYNIGAANTALKKHHLVIMPDGTLYNARMNPTNTTVGGYVGSEMHTSGLETAKTAITNAFGSAVLSHQEYLSNAATDGKISGLAILDSAVEIPEERMLYGTSTCIGMNNTIEPPCITTASRTQLSLFQVAPGFTVALNAGTRQLYWLRDIVSKDRFAYVYLNGVMSHYTAGSSAGVRPVFAIG